jgi:hypothetical protein
VILASILFFILVWTGSLQVLKRIRNLLSYFLWAGRESRAKARVVWSVICQKYRDGGLGILDPEQAMAALLSKWVLLVFQPGNTNVQLFLRYRLLHTQPYADTKWVADPGWPLLPNHKSKPGSKLWNRVSKAWKLMVKDVVFEVPDHFYSVLYRRLWLEDGLSLIGPHMSKGRAAELFRIGMQTIRDVWDLEAGQLYEWEEICERFPLGPDDRAFWRQLTNFFPRDWSCNLRIGPRPLRKGESVGLFPDDSAKLPSTVFKVTSSSLNLVESMMTSLHRPVDTCFYSVGSQSQTLHREDLLTRYMRPWNEHNSQPDAEPGSDLTPSGMVKRVRVVPLAVETKNVSRHTLLLYYGPVVDLTFDPKNYSWSDGSPLMAYTAKKGREFLRQRTP